MKRRSKSYSIKAGLAIKMLSQLEMSLRLEAVFRKATCR